MDGRARIVLAAGGTGGHLFPAFALAEELRRRGYAVELMTDMRGDRYGTGFPAERVHCVPAATVTSKSPVALARTALTLGRGIMAARTILKSIEPAAIVGFGGYPSFPPLMAATHLRIPSALHEQNAVLGRANRKLARYVDRIATSFETTRFLEGPLLAKARFTGNPVRDQVINVSRVPYPSVESGPLKLLVFGGSQGARFFSEVVPAAFAAMRPEIRRVIDVVQQAREEDVAAVRAAYAAAGVPAEVATFFKDLPERIATSHLVIARAGASSVAELSVIGRPSILVPLPHALDNDQLQNATRLAESGGAWCIEQKNLTPEALADAITTLIEAPSMLVEAAAHARSEGRPDAVLRLADLVEELALRPA
ncbi:MAG: undecaprenyldiphospho-muramoylpentapeptide beta-N-acetylglucosaminyltransferase [Hyphomicrobium sp.]|nr:undecaprenyldiphospho-muramoylpentapeptide beta-N-acetylglucosaminyltransferase [Hyphomicrobium sp.]